MEVLTAAGPPMEAPMEAPMEDERMHQRQLQASCLDARQRVASENKGFAERRFASSPPASQQPFTVPNSLCKLPFNKDPWTWVGIFVVFLCFVTFLFAPTEALRVFGVLFKAATGVSNIIDTNFIWHYYRRSSGFDKILVDKI